ncbi:lysozyme inhibitor LprI family protein [Burkholderia sola]|uniref:lysozyme inhibitor LprI family protein n=1 Tax=Burkholderia sola TaxID=2843302 RepID=UPI00338E2F43
MYRIVFLVAAVAFPLVSIAASHTSAQSERELRGECSNGVIGVRECLQGKQEASEVELRRAGEKVRNALAKWDEDSQFIRLATTRLAASKKAFVKYREAQCAFASSLGGGAIGNALEMRRLACVAELNNRRAAQLRDAVSDLPLK